jgi:hypothetical protein
LLSPDLAAGIRRKGRKETWAPTWELANCRGSSNAMAAP